jgi:hypothetical protein
MADVQLVTAVDAVIRAAALHGHGVDDPRIIQETNNVVVWLYPHAVIAKVGRRSDSFEPVLREDAVAAALARLDAPVAAPLSGTRPFRDEATGFIVTLWQRLDVVTHHDVARV